MASQEKSASKSGKSEGTMERYRAVFDSVNRPMAVYAAVRRGSDFVIRDINPAAEETEKLKREDVTGKSILQVFPGVRDSGLCAVLQRVWKTGLPEHFPAEPNKDKHLTSRRDYYVFRLPSGEVAMTYEDVTKGMNGNTRGSSADLSQITADPAGKRENENLSALEEWRSTFDSIPDMVSIHSRDFRLVRVNMAFASAFGTTPDNLVGRHCYEVIHGSNCPVEDCPNVKTLRSGKTFTGELFEPRLGIHIQASTSPIFDEKGEVMGSVHIARDISDRKRSEQALREREELYRLLADNSDDVIWTTDTQLNITYVSPSLKKMRGYEPHETQGQRVTDTLTPESLERAGRLMADNMSEIAMGSRKTVRLEVEQYCKDGSTIWAEAIIRAIYDNSGAFKGLLGTSRNITERKKAEQALAESERRFSSAFNISPDPVAITDADSGRIIEINPAFTEWSGYSRDELIGRTTLELNFWEDPAARADFAARLRQGGQVTDLPTRFHIKNGEIRNVLFSARPVEIGGRRLSFSRAHDLTERLKNEAEMQLRSMLLDSANDSIFMLDLDGKFLYVNEACCRERGYTRDELLSMSVLELSPPEMAAKHGERVAAVIEKGDLVFYSTHLCKNGRAMPVEVHSRVIKRGGQTCLLSVARDITERIKAGSALRESEEMLRSMLNAITETAMLLDRDGTLLATNAALARRFGKEPEALQGKNMYDLLPPELASARRKVLNRVIESGQPLTFEDERGGNVMLNSIYPVLDASGKVARLAIFSIDMTERKKAEMELRHSEAKFRAVVENSHDGIMFLDRDAMVNYRSPYWDRITGYNNEDRLGKYALETVHPDDIKSVRNSWDRLLQNPAVSMKTEYRISHRDGRWLWVETTGQNLLDNPDVGEIVTTSREITENKKSESLIRKNEARLNSQLKIAQYQEKDLQDLLDFALEEAIQLTGSKIGYIYFYSEETQEFVLNTWSREVMKECTVRDAQTVYHLDKTGLWGEAVRQRKPIIINDFRAPHPAKKGYPDGHAALQRFLTIPVISDDKIVSVVGVANKPDDYDDNDVRQLTLLMDNVWKVAERRRVEEQLAASESRYRGLIEDAAEAVFIVQDGFLKFANSQAAQVTGYERKELADLHFSRLLHPEDLDRMGNYYRDHIKLADLPPAEREFRIISKGGQARWVDINVLSTEWEGKLAHIYLIHDVSESKRISEQLKTTEQRFNQFFEQATNFCYMISPDGNILNLNGSALNFLGYASKEDVIGKPVITTLYPPQSRERAKALLARWKETGHLENEEVTIASRDGEERQVLLSVSSVTDEKGKLLHSISIQTDITERKRLLEEQARLSKLESVGTLAGGIAHDFNNILGAVLGNISLARAETPRSGTAGESLADAEKAILRAKDLTKQLLTFSRGGAPVKSITSLREIIMDSARFATRGSPSKCRFEIAEGLWQADVDSGQISQVINNLVINARQAMPSGGQIYIVAENITLNGERTRGKVLPLPAGKYVRISVQDSGVGIPDEHIDRIFDPYFTTKQDGSGLGLATSFSIVRNHGGHIGVESQPGHGSTFFLYLPSTDEPARPKVKDSDKAAEKLSARVLVMDDEAALRDVVKAMLRHIGIADVVTAANGADTVQLYKEAMQAGQPFDAVILDLTVPGGMGGRETIEAILEIDPGAAGIVSSGYAGEPVMAEYSKYGFKGMIAKPYTLDELRNALRTVLDKPKL